MPARTGSAGPVGFSNSDRGDSESSDMKLLSYKPIDFSLTAGTDIPPPPPSPPPLALASKVESEALRAQTKEPLPLQATQSPAPTSPSTLQVPGFLASPPPPAQSEAFSPSTSPKTNKNSSGRRLSKFLSVKSLNSVYGPEKQGPNSSTPNLHAESPGASKDGSNYLTSGHGYFDRRPSAASVASSSMTATKRVRSWFRRKRKFSDVGTHEIHNDDDDGRNASLGGRNGNGALGMGGDGEKPQKDPGPPPPMLPEVGRNETTSVLGGGEMFRDIK
ncbi:MAG: hypothetical protein M1837_001013 [Sclerophora amabilis]|nr:MAG: hypothetical protein M1837_001013 [Sclerophora amabilis]